MLVVARTEAEEAAEFSYPRQKRSAAVHSLKPRIHRMRPFTPRWSCSNPLFLYAPVRCFTR